MSWLQFKNDYLIKETHLDTFGHVNNAVYLQLFEQARWDFVTERGFGFDKIFRDKVGPTVLEVHLSFKREIKLRQTITIVTQIKAYNGKIGEVEQQIVGQDGSVHCIANFKIALFDISQRKLIAPTPEWLSAVGFVDDGK